MRLFVAIDVPLAIKEAIERDVVSPLREVVPGAKWSRPEGRHLTLKFLGETEQVDAVTSALEHAVVGHRPFEARFAEVGGFPSLRRPRVLWVGIDRGTEEAVSLAGDVEAALAPLGFAGEQRPFHPHLTIGRIRRPSRIPDVPSVEVPSQVFEVSGITLFRSQLHPHGARYTRVMAASLA